MNLTTKLTYVLELTPEEMEAMGFKPLLVRGHALNFKVTYAEDLSLAEWVLAARSQNDPGGKTA
mgnify:CR=1 FL=1